MYRKNLFRFSASLLAISLCTAVSAETFTVEGAGNISGKTWSPHNPTVDDENIDIHWITTSGGQTLSVNVDYSAYDIRNFTYNTFNNNPKINLLQNFSIKGDLIRDQVGGGNQMFRIYGTDAALSIGGDVHNTGGNANSLSFGDDGADIRALKSLNVEGDIISTGFSGTGGDYTGVRFNVTEGAAIKGRLVFNANSYTILNQSAGTSQTRSVRVGGVSATNAAAVIGGEIGDATVRNNSAWLTLTGTSANQTYSGIIRNRQSTVAAGATSTGRLNVVVDASNANFTQTFDGTNAWTGDTVLSQGNLKLKASATNIGSIFLGYDTVRDTTTDVVTSLDAKADAETSIIFDGVGATVENFNWNSGVLGMILADETQGTAVLTVGGTMTFGIADAFHFLFEGITIGETYVLIETDTDLSTYLDKFTSNYGNDFSYADGKLSFTTTAIPEPSTYAVVFASLCCAFAVYRRKAKN